MEHLIYISGPPCSGKTSICKSLLQFAPYLSLVVGNRFWLKHEGLPFQERVVITNQMILESIQSMTETHLLLEWVPSSGSFCDKLKSICKTNKSVFSHIVLYAPIPVLEQRKLERDGDCDVGRPDVRQLSSIDDALTIDTTQQSQKDAVNRCIEALISNKVLQRTRTSRVAEH